MEPIWLAETFCILLWLAKACWSHHKWEIPLCLWSSNITYLKLGWQFALVCWHLLPHLSMTPCCTLHVPQCKIQDDHWVPLVASMWCWRKCLCSLCNWVWTLALGLLGEQREHFSNRSSARWRLKMDYINTSVAMDLTTYLHSVLHCPKVAVSHKAENTQHPTTHSTAMYGIGLRHQPM